MTVETEIEVRDHEHLIGGESMASGEAEPIVRLSPVTGRPIARVAAGTPEDAARAITAARKEFDHGVWPRLRGSDRGRILNRWADLVESRADLLMRLEVEEVGKPLREARGNIEEVVELIQFTASLAHNLRGALHDDFGGRAIGMVSREPIGVVGVILPWNYPAVLFADTVPFALASGCTVIVKPSEFTSGTAIELARLAHEAGVPSSALNVITGKGAEVAMPLAVSPDVEMISFTGSTRTGKLLSAADAPYPKRISLELGGKGATIVFADADLEAAVDGALFGVCANQGETCCAGTRLLVEESVADDFVARLSARAQALNVGDPLAEETEVGALIHEQHLERVLDYIGKGVDGGAELATGGVRLTRGNLADGNFVPPTILDRVPRDNPAFVEEIFGPVLSVTRFSGVEEAARIANATPYGLANSVWTRDIDHALTLGRTLRSGTVWINTSNDGAPQLPFGGYKASGVGRAKGAAGLDEFTQLKTIHVRLGDHVPFYPKAASR